MTEDKQYIKEEIWKDYNPGDKIEGILVDILEDIGEYNNTLYKIRTIDAFIAVWGSKDLDEKIEKQKINIGMNLRITFNGFLKTSNGYDMKDFTVEIID